MSSIAARSVQGAFDLLSQTCKLADGRTLSYAEFGDPQGYPLMIFHGYPGCRLEAWSLHSMFQRKHIRLISPDRPGFGRSTFLAGRRMIDYPSDIRELADHLGLDRFAIMGYSGGGPYAVACAKDIPANRLSAVGLLASAGPWAIDGDSERKKELMKDERFATKFWAGAVKNAPRVTDLVTRLIIGSAKWLFSQKWFVSRLDTNLRKSEEKAGKKLEEDYKDGLGPGERLALVLKETFHQGSCAMMQEATLLFSSWGFDVSQVNYDKIQLWHGTRDIHAPLGQIQYAVDRLPHCELKTFDVDHCGILNKMEEVLDDLITDKVKQQ
jgi:pimeloyl-ACP methyl ester carboxylesterase